MKVSSDHWPSRLLLASCCVALLAGPSCSGSDTSWSAYLGDVESTQYSPLDQIHRGNVASLDFAWIYNTGDADPGDRSQIQCNPLVIDGVLYGSSPSLKFFALDAATGEERWVFDPIGGDYPLHGGGVNRGLVYWEGGGEPRLLVTASSRLYALDARSGRPIESFGEAGSVDLHAGLGARARDLFVVSNTPGVVYEDLLILGTRVSESHPAAPGDIRAYDVRTGEIVWRFRTIPHPGEEGHETWPEDAHLRAGGANAWAGMSLDEERGIVYVPTGAAAYDFYGADRHGANLFANTLLALDASTGRKIWHRQLVHHDLWDRDLPAPPNLLSVHHAGERIDAVAQITKSAHVFLFDRATGEPLFPIEERPVPASDLPGEAAWPTQPLPSRPPPFARQAMTPEEVTNLSPEAHDYVMQRLAGMRTGGPFIPPSREGTVILPGLDGGGQWGGAAVDPGRGILYVNASEMPWVMTMVESEDPDGPPSGAKIYATHCQHCHGVDRRGDQAKVYPSLVGLRGRYTWSQVYGLIRQGKGIMPPHRHLSKDEMGMLVNHLFEPQKRRRERARRRGMGADAREPASFMMTGYTRFLDEQGLPAIKPPWGTLSAIDLNGGELLWQVALGELRELTRRGIPPTGTENYGGPIVTAGGIVFIAATRDSKLRAFDHETGEVLWEATLPAPGFATPATYSVNGRQFVVIAAGGGKLGHPSGDAYVAYALP